MKWNRHPEFEGKHSFLSASQCHWLKYTPEKLVERFENEKAKQRGTELHPIGFIDGFVTDDEILTDEMFADASMHNPDGAWQMIFGLNTMPAYRNRGVGGQLIEAFIELAKEENRKGVILTCKEEKIHYYAKFGFVNEGESVSDHGGAKWYQMRVVF